MTKRRVRLEALQLAANLLSSDSDNPGPVEHLPIEDAEKVMHQLLVISKELEFRAEKMAERMGLTE